MGKYYLYRYIREDKNIPFYVGIGSKRKNRIFNSLCAEYERAYSLTNRNKHFLNIIKNISYSIEIIFETDSLNEIKEKEKEFILLYGRIDLNTGTLVNLTDGGDGHYNMSYENRKKIGELIKERFKDKKQTKEHIGRRIEKMYGRKLSPETIQKRTNTRKENAIERGYYVPQSKIENESKKIVQYDKEHTLIKIWSSINLASRTLNIPKSNIINVCKGKNRYKTAGGFIWKYINNC